MKHWLAVLLTLIVAISGNATLAADAPPATPEKKVTKKNPPKADTRPKPDEKTKK